MSTTNNELHRIKEELATLPRGRARRIPPEVRVLIDRYVCERAAEGVSRNAIARELGVGESTIVRALKTAGGPLRRVRILPASPKTPNTMTVHGPGGLTIEGLDVDGLAALIRALSC